MEKEIVEEQEDGEDVEQAQDTEKIQEEQTDSLESMIEVVPAPGEKVDVEEEPENEIKAEVNKNTNIYDPNAAKSSSSDVVVVEINN